VPHVNIKICVIKSFASVSLLQMAKQLGNLLLQTHVLTFAVSSWFSSLPRKPNGGWESNQQLKAKCPSSKWSVDYERYFI